MNTGQELYNALYKTRQDTMESVNLLSKYGKTLSLCERDYRVAYRAEVFILHDQEKVAWTAAVDIARGEESIVANLRYERDIAKVNYTTEQERLNVLKIELRILENEYKESMRQS